ncbi:MAG: phosphatidate cytidylyltransferase [Oscillospiraceae bacterium]|nr:phosphatidate cytidylyltransferase [Oscillospiraceae bacterium]
MKQRLISIGVGFILLAAVLYWFDTFFLNVVFALIGGLAMFEVLRAYKINNLAFDVVFIGYVMLTVLFETTSAAVIYLLIFFAFFIVMVLRDRHYLIKESAGAFLSALTLSLGFNALLTMRAMTPYANDGRFMFFIALALGWICDTFGYFCGHAWGKKKLCPAISPNKTVAGAVGGVLGTPLVILLFFWLYSRNNAASAFYGFKSDGRQILFVFVLGMVGAFVGIIGDLAASYIKRECGIKDFGKIMPGHGGAMDRMDSVLFTSALSAFAFDLYFRWFVNLL